MNAFASFSRMRGDSQRDWYRQSDIMSALRAIGPFTWNDARKVLAGMPRPEKRYGHYRYTAEHYDAVIHAAEKEYGCTIGTGMGGK
ncbi:MAG: hypothetical protein RLZZ21_1376 [Planctomycetota bacterium]|jgi:hypothetical protein